MDASILSLQVGQLRTFETLMPGKDKPVSWTSTILKEPVSGPVWVDQKHIEGDAQAERHPDSDPGKVIYLYPSEHYPLWRKELGKENLPYGGLGENVTTQGLLETEVCIGDIYRAGEVLMQIGEPRRPCYKISLLLQVPDMMDLIASTGRTGWYSGILKEGCLEAGMPLTLVDRPAPGWTIARIQSLLTHPAHDLSSARQLVENSYLSPSFRKELERNLQKTSETA